MIKYLFLIIELILICNIFTKYYIQGYYSFKRYLKSAFSFFWEIKYYIYYLLICIAFIISFFNELISYIFIYIANLYFFVIIPKIKLSYKRRGLFLFFLSTIIICLCSMYKYIYHFLVFILFFIIPLSNLILLPFERKINEKYLKKAKQKIEQYNPIVIGITGSFGKTTFKEYLYACLKNKYKVLKSTGNYNTLMGLCKFINQELITNCDMIILEMGIDEPHGLLKYKKLCDLDIGVIVGVGKVHLSTFKTYENIVNSKCEIDLLIKDNGILFFNQNYDDLNNKIFKHKSIGYKKEIDIINDKLNIFQINAINGIIKICKYLNVEDKYVNYFLRNVPNVSRRFDIKENQDMFLINDSYNINKLSIEEDIKYMNSLKGIKIIVTGGLIELGKDNKNANFELGLKMKKIDYLFLISRKKNHPLIQGYKNNNYGKFYIVNNTLQARKIIEKIEGKKIVLLSAKGSDFYVS